MTRPRQSVRETEPQQAARIESFHSRWGNPRMFESESDLLAHSTPRNWLVSPFLLVCSHITSLPEFMNFKLFGKTILVAITKFELLLGHPPSQ